MSRSWYPAVRRLRPGLRLVRPGHRDRDCGVPGIRHCPGLSSLACLLSLFLVAATPVRADGGHIALHRTEGAYTITLFTAPNPLVPGAADLSVLLEDRVEDAETEAVVREATVEARLVPESGTPQLVKLTHAASSNPLLLAGSLVFAKPGSYQVELRVAPSDGVAVMFTTVLVVEPDHRRRNTLVFALLLPMLVVGLFLLNQHAKRLEALRRVEAR